MVSFFSIRRQCLAVALLALGAMLAGCGSMTTASEQMVGLITPYRPDQVQGNAVTRERLEVIKVGMQREQVRSILGTPMVASVFHANRWDYVFVLHRDGQMAQKRRLTLLFNGEILASIEGDAMPSEVEFVASIGKKSLTSKTEPAFEATPEQLAQFPMPAPVAPETPTAISPPSGRYPPLEPVAR
jgi:outer membrane protein assembly factor BamE